MPRFVSPPNPAAFNAQVWEVVRRIPAGKVLAYGQVGALVAVPEGLLLKDYDAFRARWVGGALAACPDGVPWWRVINAQGKISPRPGAEKQRMLLEAEQVTFDAKDRIDLARFGWNPEGE
ncbi:MAG: MGMT family protein [Anaerolineales bacterium]|jgi:methylated-DNA-protein-cysteine methyltransferase-like protein|nr:MGMT family protein [Anaerolineales bacterium]